MTRVFCKSKLNGFVGRELVVALLIREACEITLPGFEDSGAVLSPMRNSRGDDSQR